MLQLSNLPNSIINYPHYDRNKLKSKIVHIGFGAFHRAHQAVFTDRLLNLGVSDWGICGVSIISGASFIKDIRKQQHLYTVLEKGFDFKKAYIIGSIKESLSNTIDGVETILEKMANPEVEIVSLTVTEKGYCLLPGGTNLDLNNTLIKTDLKNPSTPQSAPGFIVEALSRRMQRSINSFTVLSCDNMPENGHALKKAVIGLAKARDENLAQWIEKYTTFPCTMVDRIVPASTFETLTEIQEELGGMEDLCGIACEQFIQWVIEDNFVSDRPDWDKVGAEFVKDVVPYEEMKLRMLNGSHSFLAYLGYLAGYKYINECMNDNNYKQIIFKFMMDQQVPTLHVSKNVNLKEYATTLIERFSNPSLKHQTWQIAMDGTQKLPQRILDSIRWHIKNNSDYNLLALSIAGWIRYISGIDDENQVIDIIDPMVEKLHLIVNNSLDGKDRVNKVFALEEVFGQDLSFHEPLINSVCHHYESLIKYGAKETIANIISERRRDD